MVNLFDIMRQAGSGSGLETLSRQFGLDGAQMQRVVAALLPAYSMALRRTAQDPASFSGLLDLLTSGRYLPAFDKVGFARSEGEELLRTLFGSGEVARRVADQASAMTGVGVGVLQRMMPEIAAILVGGLFRYASLEGFADLLRQWSDALRAAAPKPAPPPKPDDPWSAWFRMTAAMMGQPAAAPSPPKPAPPASPFEAWAQVMSAMMGARQEAPPPPERVAARNPFEALSQMFEAGREVQAQNLAAFQSILDGGRAPPSRPA